MRNRSARRPRATRPGECAGWVQVPTVPCAENLGGWLASSPGCGRLPIGTPSSGQVLWVARRCRWFPAWTGAPGLALSPGFPPPLRLDPLNKMLEKKAQKCSAPPGGGRREQNARKLLAESLLAERGAGKVAGKLAQNVIEEARGVASG